MNLWDKKGVPHKGWKCVDMIDLCEDQEDVDYETRKSEIYIQCEMCGQDGIRYIHVMEHPEWNERLNVGLVCASKMEDEYNSNRREADLKNRSLRKVRFMKSEWRQKSNGNLVLQYKGDVITIMPSKYKAGQYCVVYDGRVFNKYKCRSINNVHMAKQAAFEILDQEHSDVF